MRNRTSSWIAAFIAGLTVGHFLSPLYWPAQAQQQRRTTFRGQSAVLLERIARNVEQIAATTRRIEKHLSGGTERKRPRDRAR